MNYLCISQAGQTISQALFLALVLGGGAAAILTLQVRLIVSWVRLCVLANDAQLI